MRILFTFILLYSFYYIHAADYYWVGGSGNWSDISHWAAASGGTVKYPVAPTSEDNVIFDENSFDAPGQVVTFKNNIIFCKSMDWSVVTNNPTLRGAKSVTVSVFGDLLLSNEMSIAFEGKFLLTGSMGNKRVDFAGNLIPGVVTFEGESTWSVESALEIDSMLEISRGNVHFNENDINCQFFHINTFGTKEVNLTNSNIVISGSYQEDYGYDGDGSVSMIIQRNFLTLNAEGSVIDISAANPELRYLGQQEVKLDTVRFSATTGSALLNSTWHEEPIEFGELSFNSSARVEGSFNAEMVSFGAGGRYRLGAERRYQIGDVLAAGDCVEGVIVTSDNPGVPVNIELTSGNVDVDFITARDIHIEGGLLNANNGVDLGNNMGWNFNNTTAVDYYWVGGSGWWDDPSHWSLTSGGPSAGCIPSGKDNAFFDVNSFTAPNQSVRLNNRSTFIHDMIWSDVIGAPEFTSRLDQRMVVTGSLELDPNMKHDISGYYDFESIEKGNTITTNGKIFNESISFAGTEGEWLLVDDVEVYRAVYFNSGTLDINGNQLIMTRMISNSNRMRNLDISDSYLFLRESQYLSVEWNVHMQGFMVDATNSTIEFVDKSSFQHDGQATRGKPHYAKVIFNNVRGGVTSFDELTDESETSVIVDDMTFSGRGNFTGSTEVGILRLAEGFSYVFDSNGNRRQVISEIITQGSCDKGTTMLFGSTPGERGHIELRNNEMLERMYIFDIEILGSTLTNNNSIDGGNNIGMTFNELSGRTLYWVGDGGLWQDVSHWSLNSGGAGGECIPTPLDDVVFDQNSFSSANQTVETIPSQFAYCKNFSFTNQTQNPRIWMDYLQINGSIRVDNSFRYDVSWLILTGELSETIVLGGQQLENVRMRGQGQYTFMDQVMMNNLIQNSGEIVLNDILVECNSIATEGNRPMIMTLGKSEITFYINNAYGFNDRSRTLTVNPGQSTLIFPKDDVGVFSLSKIKLHDIRFTNPGGRATIASRQVWDEGDLDGTLTVSSISFNGDGQVIGNLVADTLIGVAGKVYTLNQDRDYKISEYLQLRGNNCTPIELRSSANDVKARIKMPATAEVVVDFVQMKDIVASGGADFNAGSRSVDVGGSNRGWTFQDAPDFIETGFLGMDRAICEGEDLELSAFSYSPKEQYVWSDGSTDSILLVERPGLYYVEVQFQSNCVLHDTILVVGAQEIEPELPDSTLVCSKTNVELDVSVPYEGASYYWNTGSDEPRLLVDEEGKYSVVVEVLGCTKEDSTIVKFVDDPGDILWDEISICEGEEFLIVPMVEGDQYQWQDGSTDKDYVARLEGNYHLLLSKEGCEFMDSLFLSISPLPAIDLQSDTTICEGDSLRIVLDEILDYQWSDGSSDHMIEMNGAGKWWVSVTDANGCMNRDSVMVSTKGIPEVNLGDDLEVCANEEVILKVPDMFEDFEWEDGSIEKERLIIQEGEYQLFVRDNGCKGSDQIKVEMIALPNIDIGPADTLFCEERPLRIEPLRRSPGKLTWQDLSEEEFFIASVPGLVTATVFDGLCENSDTIRVDYKDCVFFDVYIPNAFSPNDDGYNDQFEIFVPEDLIVNSFSLLVYDRWGNQVFSSQQIDHSWDGSFQTKVLDNGVYIYTLFIEYTDVDGTGSQIINGDITIFK
ncbi:T9SS type B sorting domain-containing protein [Portibacter marinus]|uniref:T9SS type B sorting domain-containing protein n=1 Tax=Portibacter marinus TaxID=2898660 RepID=UPI001F1951F3|nr:gliding motility-associated C-terminal domain-containing protein [Portibacter marinus]